MHVLFVEPRFPSYQANFVRALAAVGARVTGIGESPPEVLGPDLTRALAGYEQVRSVVDEDALEAAVRRVQARGWVDRLEATIEAHILPAAHVRERTSIPGTTVRTAWLCRDKPSMKQALREAGVPTARSRAASTVEEARAFVTEVGYPLIVKPRSAAGASGTVRVDHASALEGALGSMGIGHGGSVALEEYVSGHEGFYDTLSIGGHVAHDFLCHYYPNVLEAMRTRWISPQIVATNRMDAPGYREVKVLGGNVIRALGIGTSATHMEWFYGPKGLFFSEIGCRPPGVGVWDLYSAANEFDLYREWAHAIVHGRPETAPSRRFSAGMIALRPDRDGRVAGYDGVERLRQRFSEWIVDTHFPAPGTATQPVEAGYMANAWVRMKHPDYDHLRSMLDWVGENVRVRAV